MGLLLDIPISRWMRVEEIPERAQYTVIRSIHFVDEDTLAVTFFGRKPIGYVLSLEIVQRLELVQTILSLQSLSGDDDSLASGFFVSDQFNAWTPGNLTRGLASDHLLYLPLVRGWR